MVVERLARAHHECLCTDIGIYTRSSEVARLAPATYSDISLIGSIGLDFEPVFSHLGVQHCKYCDILNVMLWISQSVRTFQF
jgi:hypothetical protein